jgi:hypothetical protein
VGSPEARQASTPPTTSPTRSNPIARNQEAARLEEYPSRHSRITRVSSGSFALLVGHAGSRRQATTDSDGRPRVRARPAGAARRPSARRRARLRARLRRTPPGASGARSTHAHPRAGGRSCGAVSSFAFRRMVVRPGGPEPYERVKFGTRSHSGRSTSDRAARSRRASRYSLSTTWIAPAIGIAPSAPTIPASSAPISTAARTTSGESCTVRP